MTIPVINTGSLALATPNAPPFINIVGGNLAQGSQVGLDNPASVAITGGSITGVSVVPSVIARLQRQLAGGLKAPALSAVAPTITQLGPNLSNNTQATGIASGVTVYAQDVIAGTDTRFSLLNNSALDLIATSNDAKKFYAGPQSASSDAVPTMPVGFYTDAPVVEIGNRRDESWQVLVDGALASSAYIATPTGTSFGLTRTVLTFAARLRRKFIAYGQTSGFWGIGIGPTDTLEPLDFSREIFMAVMSDSYGSQGSGAYYGGPFWYAAQLMGINGFEISPGGGSGYDTLGNGGRPTFMTRLTAMAARQPDILLTSGGINDPATIVNPPAYFANARAAAPNTLLVATGPWTPNAAQRTSMSSRRDSIYNGLSAVAGPWIFIDNTTGAWTAKPKSGPTVTGLAGYGPWQTGTGTVSAPAGAGNGDFYVQADTTHPVNPTGVVFLGLQIASALRDAVMAMAG